MLRLDKKLLPGPWGKSWWQCAALGLELAALCRYKRSDTLFEDKSLEVGRLTADRQAVKYRKWYQASKLVSANVLQFDN